jgi:Plavaka transposase
MSSGFPIVCADRRERHCYPVLSQYIADMEEQVHLASVIKGRCPKCLAPGMRLETKPQAPGGRKRARPVTTSDPSLADGSYYARRTDGHAAQIRQKARRANDNQILQTQGYHINEPFSSAYPLGGILEALCPDLLHQPPKCFMDHLWSKIVHPLLVRHCQKEKLKEKDLLMELDSRFILMPKYPNLRRFTKGVFTQNHTWTVHEYRAMMRVILGILAGICPPPGIQLVREYLHITYLSHYPVQTDKTLGWLQSAVDTFWKLLRDPNGPFLGHGQITEHWAPSKLHMFRHYASEAKEKGALTTISTDRTEIWHKVLKAGYVRSNRSDKCNEFIVKYVSRITAFRVKVSNLDLESPGPTPAKQVIDDEPSLGTEPSSSGGDRGVELEAEGNDDEELELEPEAVPSTPKGMAWRWPKRVRKGWPRLASSTEEALGLGGFRAAVASCNRMQPASTVDATSTTSTPLVPLLVPVSDDDDPMIYVFNGVQIAYPAMSLSYLINTKGRSQVNDPHELVVDDAKCVNEHIRSGPVYGGRRDFVLVKRPTSNTRTQETSMTYRSVAELLLLFKCNRGAMDMMSAHSRGSDVGEYAYVQWMNTVGGRPDKDNGMYTVRRTRRTAVIHIGDIERSVHLIPKYGRQIGATTKLMRKLQDTLRDAVTGEIPKAPSATAEFEEFWLNSWIDNHMYNQIY